ESLRCLRATSLVRLRPVRRGRLLQRHRRRRDLHSFPTRRSSDLLLSGQGIQHAVYRFQMFRLIVAHALETGADIQEIPQFRALRSEEHTSELQSRENLVCRLLLEKKKLDGRAPDQVHSSWRLNQV